MAFTRDFKETIKKRVECDPDFAKSLLHEAVDLMLDGDSATAKLILRDLINATVGFERFATIKKALNVRIDTTVTAV